jgi:hypothetical protein
VANSDPHRSLAPDRLHIFHSGLFNHLWNETKRHIEALGRGGIKQVDDQFVSPVEFTNQSANFLSYNAEWLHFHDGEASTILVQL